MLRSSWHTGSLKGTWAVMQAAENERRREREDEEQTNIDGESGAASEGSDAGSCEDEESDRHG